MKTKLRVFLGLAILSLIPVVGCGHGHMMLSGPTFGYGARAERSFSQPLGLTAGQTLALSSEYADLEVEMSAEDKPRLDVVLVAYARNKQDAQDLVERCGPSVKSGENRVAIEDAGEPLVYGGPFGTTTIRPHARYHAVVPAGTPLEVELGSGSIEAQGPLGACKLATGYGSVDLADAEGNVDVESESGEIDLRGIRGGTVAARSGYGALKLGEIEADRVSAKTESGRVELRDVQADRVELESGYGGITVEEAKGNQVAAKTQSGHVEFDDVRAQRIVVESGYGTLALADVAGEVTAETSSGAITLSTAEVGPWDLSTGYGDVQVRKVSGSLLARSESGGIRVDGFSGQIDAESGYGSLVLDGVFSNLSAVTSSGKVDVQARTGSAAAAPWTLRSGYGSVELGIPEEFSCRLDARTDYGSIQVALPMLAEEMRSGSEERVSGVLGSGGETVTLETDSGTILVQDNSR